MANSFGTDILIQSPDPKNAAAFYVEQLGFEITGETPMLSLHGKHINLFIELGPTLGPVFEVTVASVEEAKLKDLPEQDPRACHCDFSRHGIQTPNRCQIIDRGPFNKLHCNHAGRR